MPIINTTLKFNIDHEVETQSQWEYHQVCINERNQHFYYNVIFANRVVIV